MKRSIFLAALFCICMNLYVVAQSQNRQNYNRQVTLSDELRALYDVSELPFYRSNSVSAQVSSYDTTGGNEDGFNGNYSFVRRNPDSTLVLLDIKGSGVINRIWTPTPTDDTLDFYIDDTTKPIISIKYRDLFSGKVFPFTEPLCGSQLGGNFCYFPILFQQRCMIIIRAKTTRFHQIQYRLFEKNTKVKSFSLPLSSDDQKSLERISILWNKENKVAGDFISGKTKLQISKSGFDLLPGQTRSIFSLKQGGRITGIELSPSSAFEGIAKNVDIKIKWDDEKMPAVYCPVSDFFGYAFGKRSMQSLLIGSKGNVNYCYIPMPFDRNATVELIYRAAPGSLPIRIESKVYYTSEKRNPEKEGKLYTSWQTERPALGKPHVFLETTGKGHFIGTVLQAQGLTPGMTYFFEGDDSTVIDGENRLHGTGSEDYFNGGWYALLDCWDAKMSLPLHGALDYSLPFCRTGGYRFYLSDKLSFEKNFYHSMEHGPAHNNILAEYTSVSFYYSNSPVAKIISPETANTKVFIPDTLVLFPQLLDYAIGEFIGVEAVGIYPTGGPNFKFTVSSDSRLRILCRDIPIGSYRLFADYQVGENGCDFSVWQRQAKLSEWISTNAPQEKRMEQEYLCDIKIDELINTITIRFKADNRQEFFLNRLILIKKQ
ncbi:MAG: glycoside hydrolase family 172 protein [Ginsengibacter sp.]